MSTYKKLLPNTGLIASTVRLKAMPVAEEIDVEVQ